MSGFIAFSYAALSVSAAISSLIVIELWPVLAFFIFPLIVTEVSKPSSQKMIGACVSLVGAALVSISQAEALQGLGGVWGIAFAFLAASSTAIGTLIIARLSDDLGGSLDAMLLVQAAGRIISSLWLGLAVALGWGAGVIKLDLNPSYFASFILAFIVVFGSMLFSKAIITAQSRLVIKSWGAQPLLSVFALLLIGAGDYNSLLLVGSIVFVVGLIIVR